MKYCRDAGRRRSSFHLRIDIVAGIRLVPPIDAFRAAPGVFGQVAIDGDWPCQPRGLELVARQRRLRARRK
jgi:hypothetical protein